MKRKHPLITLDREGNIIGEVKDITCVVTGEMSDGTKVWQEIGKTDHEGIQYYLQRTNDTKEYYFIQTY